MSKRLFYTLWTMLVLVFGSWHTLHAQDIHFSQFTYAPLNLNPALTGIFDGDMRFMGNYRNQWKNVPVDYLNFSGAYDMNFYNKNLERSLFAGGLVFNYDRAGDSHLSTTNLGLSGSYTHQLGEKHFATVGGQLGVHQRAFDLTNLRFDDQFNNESYDPQRPTQEMIINTSTAFMDLSAGLNWHFRTSKRTYFDIGGAAYHLNTPNKSFGNSLVEEELPVRYTLYGMGTFQLVDELDLFVNAAAQWQNPHHETTLGAGINIHLNTRPDHELFVSVGGGIRLNDMESDAIIPFFGLQYRMWHFGLSYDINVSEFNVATDRRGGPEFSVNYIITKVKPLKSKICPIYL
ncbi:MAG: PorP/SprF family type IX secretion system membrane protein [Bacteroidota bacterium]